MDYLTNEDYHMKGIGLIGFLLALLLAGYLMMKRLHAPAPETAILGTPVPLVDAPGLAKERVDEAMKKEAERLQEIDPE